MEKNKCVICGKIIADPLAFYCAECEFELKRVRLADEEPLDEWLERVGEISKSTSLKGVKPLDTWI